MLLASISDLKDVLESALHLSRDALHIHIGLCIFLALAAILPGPRRFELAFGLLLAVVFLGEIADVAHALEKKSRIGWLGSVKDVVNTMLWPAIWLLGGRRFLLMIGLRRTSRRTAWGHRPAPGTGRSVRPAQRALMSSSDAGKETEARLPI